jgi:hypothetical protein
MKTSDYENICRLNIYKNLKSKEKLVYTVLDKYHHIYGSIEWIYMSQERLHELCSIAKSSISEIKQKLLSNGLVKVKKCYKSNGNRGIDNIHLNSLEEILEFLQKDAITNEKDINRVIGFLKTTKFTTSISSLNLLRVDN